MKLSRCSKGHFYDADTHSACPLCGAVGPVVPPPGAMRRDTKPESRIPDAFLRYGTPEFCGRGSSGVVYKLVPKPAEYVVKVVRCETAAEEEAVQHELFNGMRLRSIKGLVQIEDSRRQREDGVTYWSILERAYSPLTECMQLAPLTEKEVLSLGLRLCDTLLAMQREGLLHMDLQPKNIFRDQSGDWLLGDPGGIYTLEELKLGKRVGTPAFMAPEVYRDGACSEKAVVYSLAMLLYSVLNRGLLPLEDRYPAETAIQKRLDGEDFLSLAQNVCGLRYLAPALCMDPAARPSLAAYRSLLAECRSRLSDGASVPFGGMDSAPFPAKDSLAVYGAGGIAPGQSFYGASGHGAGKDTLLPGFPAPPVSQMNSTFDGIGNTPEHSSPSVMSDPFWDGADVGMTAQASSVSDPFWDDFDLGMPSSAWDDEGMDIPAPSPISSAKRREEVFSSVGPSMPAPPATSPAGAEKAGGFFGRLFGGRKDRKPEVSPVQSAPAPTPKPLPRLSEVQFSAVFPNRFVKGEYAILEMFLYEEEYHRVVEQAIAAAETAVKESRSGVLQITEKADVCVLLECADRSVEIDGNGEHQTWYGKYLKFDFSVFLPEAYARRQVMFTATVFFNGVPASKLRFTAQCNTLREQKLELMREDILTAFVSYASQDRSRVATIIQGMKKARPDMDIFFDVETLRSGMDWERAVRAEIERRDILFLCWSLAARESRWVDREWRYAMSNKGIECIEPIPIDPPDRCPPPDELASKCFQDRELLYIKSE